MHRSPSNESKTSPGTLNARIERDVSISNSDIGHHTIIPILLGLQHQDTMKPPAQQTQISTLMCITFKIYDIFILNNLIVYSKF